MNALRDLEHCIRRDMLRRIPRWLLAKFQYYPPGRILETKQAIQEQF
jgi:hypothetical protein